MESLLKNLDNHNLDALIITSSDPHLSEYPADHFKRRAFISGFTGSAGTIIVSRKFKALFTDSRYDLMSKKQLDNSWEIFINKNSEIADFLIKKSENKDFSVGIDFETISCKEISDLRKKTEKSAVKIVETPENLVDLSWENRREIYKEIYDYSENSSRSSAEKIGFLADFLAKEKADSFTIISDLATISWLLNLRGDDVVYSPVFYAFLYVNSAGKTGLFANLEKISEKAKKNLEKSGIFMEKYGKIYEFLAEQENCFIFDENKTNEKFLKFAKNPQKATFTINLIQSEKDEIERDLIRKGHKIDAKAVFSTIKSLKNREVSNEYELSELFLKNRLAFGAKMPSFESICSVNANAAIVHYSPSKDNYAEIPENCAVLMDTGGQYQGCTTDITRCVYLGEAPEEYKFAYTMVLRSHVALAKQIFHKDYPSLALDGIAKAPMWQAKMDYGHGTGHGVGSFLNVHEVPPSISSRIVTPANSLPLKLNQLVTIEPGFYPEGKFGIRLENCYLVCDAGDDYLWLDPVTLVPFEDHLVLKDLMTEEELAWYEDYQKKAWECVNN